MLQKQKKRKHVAGVRCTLKILPYFTYPLLPATSRELSKNYDTLSNRIRQASCLVVNTSVIQGLLFRGAVSGGTAIIECANPLQGVYCSVKVINRWPLPHSKGVLCLAHTQLILRSSPSSLNFRKVQLIRYVMVVVGSLYCIFSLLVLDISKKLFSILYSIFVFYFYRNVVNCCRIIA